MKKILLILAVILLFVAGGTTIWYFSRTPEVVPTPTPITFPTSGSSTTGTSVPPMNIKGFDGSIIAVRNFLGDADTSEDPVNPGYYYLGYQTFGEKAVEVPPYLITYIVETQYFNITLSQEPIGETRKSVENYLLGKLGLTKTQLCALNYTIATPTSLNSTYAGMNLGFSFCPGAIALP